MWCSLITSECSSDVSLPDVLECGGEMAMTDCDDADWYPNGSACD